MLENNDLESREFTWWVTCLYSSLRQYSQVGAHFNPCKGKGGSDLHVEGGQSSSIYLPTEIQINQQLPPRHPVSPPRLLGFSQGSNLCHPLAARCALGGSFGRMIVMVGVESSPKWPESSFKLVIYTFPYISISPTQERYLQKIFTFESSGCSTFESIPFLPKSSQLYTFQGWWTTILLGINPSFSDSLVSCVRFSFVIGSAIFSSARSLGPHRLCGAFLYHQTRLGCADSRALWVSDSWKAFIDCSDGGSQEKIHDTCEGQDNEQFRFGTVVRLGLYVGRRLLENTHCVGFKRFRFQKF